MSGLFRPGSFTDFGVSACLGGEPGRAVRIEGPRAAALRRNLRLLGPKKPGVYGMLDRHDQLIYVGKAKNLRSRLLSYFRKGSRGEKAGKIIGQSTGLVWEVCPNEVVSLLRELELIRRWRPRWNVQGQPQRRRQTFLCLGRAPAPYVFLAHHPPARAVAAFGPVPAGGRTHLAVRRLNDLFLLRDCSQQQEIFFPEQGELFPQERAAGCLRMEIGTCLGPCTGTCTRKAYQAQVAGARNFLAGKDLGPLRALECQMAAAAAAAEFERAAALRDRCQPLAWLATVLERLRFAQQQMSFVYPVTGHDGSAWWYLIHGARTVAVTAPPTDAASRQRALHLLRQTYRRASSVELLEPYEHADGMALVMMWFRKYPQERERSLTPEQAIALCQAEEAR